MPISRTAKPDFSVDERLSQLIALKRRERPAPEFWNAFEQEFRSAQLSNLVQIDPWYRRWTRTCLRYSKRTTALAAIASAGLTALAVAINYTTSSSTTVSSQNSNEAKVATKQALKQDALFVVGAPAAPAIESPAEREPANAGVSTHYQVSVLARPSQSPTYQLRSQPRTFRPDQGIGVSDATENRFGATVIRTTGQF